MAEVTSNAVTPPTFNIEAAVSAIQADRSDSSEFYTIDGLHISTARKGMNIIRTKDGKTRKVFVRWSIYYSEQDDKQFADCFSGI